MPDPMTRGDLVPALRSHVQAIERILTRECEYLSALMEHPRLSPQERQHARERRAEVDSANLHLAALVASVEEARPAYSAADVLADFVREFAVDRAKPDCHCQQCGFAQAWQLKLAAAPAREVMPSDTAADERQAVSATAAPSDLGGAAQNTVPACMQRPLTETNVGIVEHLNTPNTVPSDPGGAARKE